MSTPLEALRLLAETARGRAEKATPGPWYVGPRLHESMVSAVYHAPFGLIVNMGDGGLGKASHDANAALIAHARADVPALASAVVRLLAVVEALPRCLRCKAVATQADRTPDGDCEHTCDACAPQALADWEEYRGQVRAEQGEDLVDPLVLSDLPYAEALRALAKGQPNGR